MYAVGLIGKHHQLFAKAVTMTLAKGKADEELKKHDRIYGKYDYAVIYNQNDKSEIRKDGIGKPWVRVYDSEPE